MKRKLSLIASSAAAIAMLAHSALAQEPTTLLWGMWGSPEEIAVHQQVADAYMAANPDVTIELWSQPWGDYFTQLDTLYAAGDGTVIPDVFFMSPIQRYAASGLIENLDSYIAEAGMDAQDYWPGALESTSFDGSVYGFPRDSAIEVLYYDKDDFDAAGLEYPNENWTWDDLAAAAEALTITDATGRVARYGLAAEGGKYFNFVGSNGGAILDDMFNPTECRLDTPESIEGVQFFADLMNNGFAWRNANLGQSGGDQSVFLADQASMIIQNASRVPAFNAAGVNYDVAPVPTAPEGTRVAGSANGAAWVMSALSDQKEAAWDFMNFLQSPEGGAAIYFAAGDAFPPTRSGAASDVFLNEERGPANKQAWLLGAETTGVSNLGWFPDWSELSSTVISPVLDSIWAGEAQPADVLPTLCDDVDAFLSERGYTGEGAESAATMEAMATAEATAEGE